MKKLILLFVVFLALSGCKAQQTKITYIETEIIFTTMNQGDNVPIGWKKLKGQETVNDMLVIYKSVRIKPKKIVKAESAESTAQVEALPPVLPASIRK